MSCNVLHKICKKAFTLILLKSSSHYQNSGEFSSHQKQFWDTTQNEDSNSMVMCVAQTPLPFATLSISFQKKGPLGSEDGCCWSRHPSGQRVHYAQLLWVLAINSPELPPSQKNWPPSKQATGLRDVWSLTHCHLIALLHPLTAPK